MEIRLEYFLYVFKIFIVFFYCLLTSNHKSVYTFNQCFYGFDTYQTVFYLRATL